MTHARLLLSVSSYLHPPSLFSPLSSIPAVSGSPLTFPPTPTLPSPLPPNFHPYPQQRPRLRWMKGHSQAPLDGLIYGGSFPPRQRGAPWGRTCGVAGDAHRLRPDGPALLLHRDAKYQTATPERSLSVMWAARDLS